MPGRIEPRPVQELPTGVECLRAKCRPTGLRRPFSRGAHRTRQRSIGAMRAERVGQRNTVGHRSAADMPDRTGRHNERAICTASRISARPTLQALCLRPQAASFNPQPKAQAGDTWTIQTPALRLRVNQRGLRPQPKWDRLPACRERDDRLEAYPTKMRAKKQQSAK